MVDWDAVMDMMPRLERVEWALVEQDAPIANPARVCASAALFYKRVSTIRPARKIFTGRLFKACLKNPSGRRGRFML